MEQKQTISKWDDPQWQKMMEMFHLQEAGTYTDRNLHNPNCEFCKNRVSKHTNAYKQILNYVTSNREYFNGLPIEEGYITFSETEYHSIKFARLNAYGYMQAYRVDIHDYNSVHLFRNHRFNWTKGFNNAKSLINYLQTIIDSEPKIIYEAS